MFEVFFSKIKVKQGIGLLALITVSIWLAFFSFPSQKLEIVFCDVGQGDAIIIQKGFNQMLIDGGPNQKVLECLANNLPFFDRTIEIVALTHPQADHLTGIDFVIDRYSVDYFLSGPEGNESTGYKKLIEKIKSRKQTKIHNPYLGEKIEFAGMEIYSLWPERSWVAQKLGTDFIASDYTKEESVLGVSTTADLNEFSLVFLLKYGGFQALFTGDADSGIQDEILLANDSLNQIDILKVPHHGAKSALLPGFLEILNPQIAVISVGKNSYGHPSGELIKKMEELGIKVRRTDLEGEIKLTI